MTLEPDGDIRLSYTPTNLEAHQRLREKFMTLLDTMRCRNEVYENRQYAGGRLAPAEWPTKTGRSGSAPIRQRPRSIWIASCTTWTTSMSRRQLLRIRHGSEPHADDHRQRATSGGHDQPAPRPYEVPGRTGAALRPLRVQYVTSGGAEDQRVALHDRSYRAVRGDSLDLHLWPANHDVDAGRAVPCARRQSSSSCIAIAHRSPEGRLFGIDQIATR